MLFIFCLILFTTILFHHHYLIVRCEMPLEHREANMVATTYALLHGINPFSIENQPEFTNVYGLLYNFFVYPFAAILGNSLQIHRFVAAIFIIGACILFFRFLLLEKISCLYAWGTALIFYSSLLYFVTPMARPDSTGLFCYLSALIVPMTGKYSRNSLILSAFLSCLAFYAKTYFLLAPFLLFSYLILFSSVKKAVFFAGIFGLFFSSSILIVNHYYDTYFSNVFFLHINFAQNDLEHLYAQIDFYLKYHLCLILLTLITILLQKDTSEKKSFIPAISIQNLRFSRPLLFSPISFSLIHYSLIVTSGVFLFKMGKHTGAWMTYLFQIISPFFLITLARIIQKPSKFQTALFPLLLINIYAGAYYFLPDAARIQDDLARWRFINKLICQYETILNTPSISTLLIDKDKKVYDTGSSEYFPSGASRRGIWRLISGPRPDINAKHHQYLQNQKRDIKLKKFDLIVTTKGLHPLIPLKNLKNNYSLLITIPISFPYAIMGEKVQNFDIQLWEPKGKERSREQKYKLFDELYQTGPENFRVNRRLGDLYSDIHKDYETASFHYEKALSIFPEDIPTLNKLGILYHNHRSDEQKALEKLLKSYLLYPADPIVIRNIGQVFLNLGKKQKAAHFFQQAEQLEKQGT